MKTRLNALSRHIMVRFKNCCYVRYIPKRLRYPKGLLREILKLWKIFYFAFSVIFNFLCVPKKLKLEIQGDMLWCGLWEKRIRIPVKRPILKKKLLWFYVKRLMNIEGLYPNILTNSMVLTLTNQNKCLSHFLTYYLWWFHLSL